MHRAPQPSRCFQYPWRQVTSFFFINLLQIPQIIRTIHPLGMQEELPPALTWNSDLQLPSSCTSHTGPALRLNLVCVCDFEPSFNSSGEINEYNIIKGKKDHISGATVPFCSQDCTCMHLAGISWLPTSFCPDGLKMQWCLHCCCRQLKTSLVAIN